MNRIILLLAPLTILFNSIAFGQNVSNKTIRWNSTTYLDGVNGDWYSTETYLTSFGTTKLEWRQANGTLLKTFNVTKARGAWPNVSQEGRIKYDIQVGQDKGVITIRRKGNELIAIISISVSDDSKLYELTIDNFSVL